MSANTNDSEKLHHRLSSQLSKNVDKRPPTTIEEGKPAYKNLKVYLMTGEGIVIFITVLICLQPHWFAPTAYNYLAVPSPTIILKYPPSSKRQATLETFAEFTFCPIIDSRCAVWRPCTVSDTLSKQEVQFTCIQTGSIAFQEEVMRQSSEANDDNYADNTIQDCLQKINASASDTPLDRQSSSPLISLINLSNRIDGVRAEADLHWLTIQRRQAHAIHTVIKAMAVVVAVMLLGCTSLFVKDWYEKLILKRFGVMLDAAEEDKENDDDDDDNAWDDRLTWFLAILGTSIVPVLILAHQYTSGTKPLEFLLATTTTTENPLVTFLIVSNNAYETAIQQSSNNKIVTLCQTPPANARNTKTCIRWQNCKTLASSALVDEQQDVVDCSNGSVVDFYTVSTVTRARPIQDDKLTKVSTTTTKVGQHDDICASEDCDAAKISTLENRHCIGLLMQELNNLKHLAGSRQTHASMQNTILLYLFLGFVFCLCVFGGMIFCSGKTIFLLNLYSRPLVLSQNQWMLYEAFVFLNFSHSILTGHSRVALKNKRRSDDTLLLTK